MFVYYRYVCIFVERKPTDMIITRAEQEALVDKYFETHNYEQSKAFMDGLKAMMDLVDKKLKSTTQQS